jgi:hypothetical protein
MTQTCEWPEGCNKEATCIVEAESSTRTYVFRYCVQHAIEYFEESWDYEDIETVSIRTLRRKRRR